jgi:multiple sugar transport system permease protein
VNQALGRTTAIRPPSGVNFRIVATAILSFVFSWNNFLFSVILAGRSTRTLSIAVYTITLPVLLVALLAQRHIVSGLTFGAVKR